MAGKSSPEAMDRMINNITKFIQVQQSVAQSLKSDYIAVGEEWDECIIVYPFTLPVDMPSIKNFCAQKNNIIIGRTLMTAPEIKSR